MEMAIYSFNHIKVLISTHTPTKNRKKQNKKKTDATIFVDEHFKLLFFQPSTMTTKFCIKLGKKSGQKQDYS